MTYHKVFRYINSQFILKYNFWHLCDKCVPQGLPLHSSETNAKMNMDKNVSGFVNFLFRLLILIHMHIMIFHMYAYSIRVITCTTIWSCYSYYDYVHFVISKDPDHHQNLIRSLCYHQRFLHKISLQSVHKFLRNVVHKQTDKSIL